MNRASKKEQHLIIGLGVLRDDQVLSSHSHLPEGFNGWLEDVAHSTPAYHEWFSKCWDQVLLVVLVYGSFKFVIAAHECLGRAHARTTLFNLRAEVTAAPAAGLDPGSAQAQRIAKRLATITSSVKGVVPPRRVLVLYEGAPKKFLTKDDQSPEYLESGGKSRLQRAIEAVDKDDDAFIFSLNGAWRLGDKSTEDDDDDEEFTFTIPPRNQQQRGAHQRHGAQIPAFSTPHVGKAPIAPRPKAPVKRVPSPSISTDFTWNGVRVSPDDKDPSRHQQASVSPLSTAIQTGLHTLSFRGKQILSAQFEKNGGGKQQLPSDSTVRGQVGNIAPSGLHWEDEIAAQLAAAGVRVSTGAGGEGDDDERLPSPVGPARGSRFGVSVTANALIEWRSPSLTRHHERRLGLSRISRGFRRAFIRHQDDFAS